MLVLAIDTTSEHGGVGLFRDLDCLASIPNTSTSGFSVTLFQMVDQALVKAGGKLSMPPLTLKDVELFAVANGPGSFTGIRTGIAAVQGWATALKRPVVGVSILSAMAHEGQSETEYAAAFMDARRGDFYLCVFKRDPASGDSASQPEGEGAVLAPEAIQGFLGEKIPSSSPVTGVVRENDLAAQALRKNLTELKEWNTVPGFLVGTIAGLGLEAHKRGKAQTPAELDALYIRRTDAELNWRS